jgi:site-specific DNA-methyltransferase (adenine-specific)
MVNRLKTTFPNDFPDGVQVDGEPADEAAALSLAARDKFQFQFWSVASVGGTARGGENRKGADRGIDGVMTFPELDPNGELKAQAGRVSRRTKRAPLTTPNIVYKQVLISVKGGATGPHHVRELIGTVDREAAAIGVLVTARQPTSEMYREAADAGVYHSPSTGKSYPKIQIITAGEIIQGKRIDTPPKRGLTQYQPAPRARRGEQGVLRELQAPYIVSSEPVEDDLRAAPDDEDQDDFDQQDTKT